MKALEGWHQSLHRVALWLHEQPEKSDLLPIDHGDLENIWKFASHREPVIGRCPLQSDMTNQSLGMDFGECCCCAEPGGFRVWTCFNHQMAFPSYLPHRPGKDLRGRRIKDRPKAA